MIRRLAFIALVMLGWTAPAEVWAQTSAIGFQAKLTGVSDGPHTMTFSLYDVESGGTPLQTVGPQNVMVTDGVVSTSIAFDALHWNGEAKWVGVQLTGYPSILERTLILTVPSSAYLQGSRADLVGSDVALHFRDSNDPQAVEGGFWSLRANAFCQGCWGVVRNDPEPDLSRSVLINPENGHVGINAVPLTSKELYIAGEVDAHRLNLDGGPGAVQNLIVNSRFQSTNNVPGARFSVWDNEVPAGDSGLVINYKYGAGGFDLLRAYKGGIDNYVFSVDRNGELETNVLVIRGGADLAESFDVAAPGVDEFVSTMPPAPGMVMSIDPASPGKLCIADAAYDTKVAGVISGANGLSPGMVMGKEGDALTSGEHPVAMTGRVWVYADAAYGPIAPGDRLTTSYTPGHAMRVSDDQRSIGAVIGKAMTGLGEGRGMVLVLVNLQ